MRISRRAFLASLGVLGTATATVAASDLDTDRLESVLVDLPIQNLPKSFEGYSIGFLTDLHIGPCSGPELTREAITIMNGAKPDLVLLGGDYVLRADQNLDRFLFGARAGIRCEAPADDYGEEQEIGGEVFERIADVLSALKAADGVLAVYGNHDLWVSPRHCREHLTRRGIRLLVNEYHSVERGGERLAVYGTDDYWAGRPKRPAFPETGGTVRIVLTHNPDYFSELLQKDRPDFDLGLAGHTHGGQIKLPLIGAPFCNLRDRRFVEGLCRISSSNFYTSRGIGTVGLPFRLNCRPEITILRLLSA